MQRAKTKADHQHLFVKDLLLKIKAKGTVFRQLIKQKGIDYYDLTPEERKQVMIEVIQELKSSEEGRELYQSIKQQLAEQADMASTSATTKQCYLIDCFREGTAFPLIKNRESPGINLQCLHGIDIKKQLRRVIWSRIFNIDRTRMAFSKWDREVTPYKLQQQLKTSLEKASVRHSLTLKTNQMDNALRIVEYFLKAQSKLPQRYHFYLALLIVDLYSFTKVEKICELGAVCLGVVDLVQYYNESIELRLTHLRKVLQIIDSESYSFIQTHYLNATEAAKNTRDLLQSFEMFRLTAGSYFLPLETSQFIVDQLLIRKKCKLDMYTLFSLMVLIASDELQPGLKKGLSLKEIFQRTRSFLKRQEFIEAYSVIYQNIPAWYNPDDLATHPNNRLLALMLSLPKQQLNQLEAQEDGDFVVDSDTPARIGHKI